VQGVLVVVGLLTFLSELGVQVAPLLASAGVVGLAMGFGAQTIVKDFLTGLFLIAEDSVSVGDNVRVGEASGTVEGMTLRTIRLRNQNGTVHIIPYSEAQVIHNRTKVFSSYLFETSLAYGSDIDRALQILAEEGERLRDDDTVGTLITKPVEVMGVEKLSETGVVVRARITTEPRGQWLAGREFNKRVAKAFAAAGLASPYTTVQMISEPAAAPLQQGPEREELRSFDPPQSHPHS
jgi:moderate conductance mechanosensitive channel